MVTRVKQLAAALRRALHVAARPVRRSREVGGLALQAYRGYGSRREALLRGRVTRQAPARGLRPGSGLRRDLVDIGKRLTRRGVPGAALRAHFLGSEARVRSDRDGYFEVRIRPARPVPEDRPWQRIGLELLEPGEHRVRGSGEVYIAPRAARHVVISDIDDTVMETGVAHKALMLWRLFVQGAASRVAFPGVGEFYRALHQGEREFNPILYVSRGPWGLYEVLDEFFQLHDIPVGPILFLREWGLSLRRPFPRRTRGHKLALIREMLALYADLPFVLIGDSGQRDPEIYAQVVREHPGRVRAIYIRNVSRDARRDTAIAALADEVVAAGSTLLLAADSFAMAKHAAAHGLISEAALGRVLAARVRQQAAPDLHPTEQVHGERRAEAGEHVDAGALEQALNRGTDGEAAPNVRVEARRRGSRS